MGTKLLLSANYNAPLSNRIAQSYNQLMLLLSTIDCSNKITKRYPWTGGIVSISDIISYHIGWGSLFIMWYEAGIDNKTVTMPGQGFCTWDYVSLARHFYITYTFDDCYKQEQMFHNVVTKIIDITQYEYTTGNLDKLGAWPWCTLKSGKQWPLSKWIQINTVSPYNRSVRVIKKSLL